MFKIDRHHETAKDKDGKDVKTLVGATVTADDEVVARVNFDGDEPEFDFVRPVTLTEAETFLKEFRATMK